jgi:hypothetical protein
LEAKRAVMSQDRVMNVFFLFTGSGSLVILTSYSSVEDPALLRKLAAKGIEKFLAYQIPITLAKERYGTHFDIYQRSCPNQTICGCSTLTVRAPSGCFAFHEMGSPIAYEPQLSK